MTSIKAPTPPTAPTDRFVQVTEFEGQKISAEQLDRLCHRYHFAAHYCADRDVVEAGCGAGHGLGLFAQTARSVLGGDLSPEVLAAARQTYGNAIRLEVFPADRIPLADRSADLVLLFEAIYYLPDVNAFMAEVDRVLRPGGHLLIATANKDLFDFTPSPFSNRYLGVAELSALMRGHGYEPSFWGYVDVSKVSLRQRLFRPIKYLANRFGIMPKTMGGKSILKKLVFGAMTEMPARIDSIPFDYVEPAPLVMDSPSHDYKVIYCAALKPKES